MTSATEITVQEERNLYQRINRALKADNEQLHKLNPRNRMYSEWGPYYIRDYRTNFLVDQGIWDLRELAKEMGLDG